jgi:hypothetical protein
MITASAEVESLLRSLPVGRSLEDLQYEPLVYPGSASGSA